MNPSKRLFVPHLTHIPWHDQVNTQPRLQNHLKSLPCPRRHKPPKNIVYKEIRTLNGFLELSSAVDVTANTAFILTLHELLPFNPVWVCHTKPRRAKVQSEDSSLHFVDEDVPETKRKCTDSDMLDSVHSKWSGTGCVDHSGSSAYSLNVPTFTRGLITQNEYFTRLNPLNLWFKKKNPFSFLLH